MRVNVIEIEGKYYPLVFSLNAAEKIEDECIQIELIGDCLVNPKKYGKNSIRVTKNILKILMEEGVVYCKYKGINNIEDKELFLGEVNNEVFFDLDYHSINKITKAIYETMIKSKKKE